MNILFLADNFPPEPNAAATRVHERAVYWTGWGHEVTVITSFPNFPQGRLYPGYRNPWRQVETRDGIRVIRVKTFIAANKGGAVLRALDFLSYMLTATLAAMSEKRPDVVVATSPQFFAAVAGWLVGRLRGIPFVFELGDIWPASIVGVGAMKRNPLLALMERLELFLYRRAARIVALTHAFKMNLTRRGIEPGKIAVVPNGVDLGRYAPRPRDAALAAEWNVADKFVIGYVGTHGMAHGLGNVLDAAELARDREDICFLLVGDGAERDMLVADVARRKLANVRMIGPQPKEAMPRIWSLCDVALVHLRDSPVFAEVIPSKIFEAMGMGLPILLAAPAGEAKGIVEADRAGLWVPPGDPAQLAAAARRLADDPAGRDRLAAAALEAAPGHSRRAQAEEMIKELQVVARA
ncbi:MAG: glycosyltransferase WbuB [Rhodospirillales bacterium]|nr:glycosyltransferase WbuB [Rhodospirillales bacterium]